MPLFLLEGRALYNKKPSIFFRRINSVARGEEKNINTKKVHKYGSYLKYATKAFFKNLNKPIFSSLEFHF